MIVNGPGQNVFINVYSISDIFCAILDTISKLETCKIKGLSCALPFALYMFLTAFSSNPLAPNPYTVSVGNKTSPPFFIISPATFNLE